MVTQQKLHSQVQAPQTWDKPTTQANIGDYIHEPFQPIMVVVDKDLLPNGKIWLLVKPVSARYTQEWLVDPEPALEPQQQQPQQEPTEPVQPAGFAGDTVGCQLQPNWEAIREYESGSSHGKLDAANKLEPMCCKADCHYSSGYLAGYNSFRQPKLLPETKQSKGWRVLHTPDWDWGWYRARVGDKCIGKYSSCEEAQSAAQKYIAAEQLRQQHRQAVLTAYSC
jgi:hypothetical protein